MIWGAPPCGLPRLSTRRRIQSRTAFALFAALGASLSPAEHAYSSELRTLSIKDLRAGLRVRVPRTEIVAQIYETGQSRPGSPCPFTLRGVPLSCVTASRLRTAAPISMQQFYVEQHGTIDFECLHHPCLFTMPAGEDFAEVPIEIKRGAFIVRLTARSARMRVTSYLIVTTGVTPRATCFYPAFYRRTELDSAICRAVLGIF